MAQAVSTQVEDQFAFQVEKQFEDLLVHNWRSTAVGREYDIYEEDGRRSPSSTRQIPGPWTYSPSARTGPGSLSS